MSISSLSDVLDSDNLRVNAASMEFADSIASHFRHGRRSRLQIAEEEMRRRFQAGTHESRRHHGCVSEMVTECFCLFFLNLIYFRNSAFYELLSLHSAHVSSNANVAPLLDTIHVPFLSY